MAPFVGSLGVWLAVVAMGCAATRSTATRSAETRTTATPNVADEPPAEVVSYTGTGAEVNGSIARELVSAGSGDRIRLALYLGARDDVGRSAIHRALVMALRRGAEVEAITEGTNLRDALVGGTKAKASRRYWSSLEAEGARVIFCEQGCVRSLRGDGLPAINHHKFFLLEIAKKRRIIQSSANDHDWGDEAFEQAISIDGAKYGSLWAQYESRYALMRASWRDGLDETNASVSESEGGIVATIGPYSKADLAEGRDVYVEAFSRIQPSPECHVGVVMGHWTDSKRGLALIARLNELHEQGCTVRAILGGKRSASRKVLDSAKFSIRYVPTKGEGPKKGVHAKFVLVRYRSADGLRQHVYSGSHNFTRGSLEYDDDAVLRIDDPAMYGAFSAYFEQIEREAR